MNKVIPLMDAVPVYKYDSQMDNVTGSPRQFPNWVDEKKKLGDIGEQFVKEFLEKKYNAIVKHQPDSAGYDFKVIIDGVASFVEVKTTNNSNRFYMSYNEIKKAQEKGTNYYLYFVQFKNDAGTLHIIMDPFNSLQLNTLFKVEHSNKLASLKMNSLEITLADLDMFMTASSFMPNLSAV